VLQASVTEFRQNQLKRVFNSWNNKIFKRRKVDKIFTLLNERNLKQSLRVAIRCMKMNVILQKKVENFVAKHVNLKL